MLEYLNLFNVLMFIAVLAVASILATFLPDVTPTNKGN
ncbi:TMhelix containing protein [Vibrio phage 3.058.O._10N.286.46.B8]|nr:TMhelix containing protein [Vibrio phage 2.058.O._10N.286.46.B8]AUS03126.1 TMhelix containing protein [Vibrio phage 3.058.O._10N.286.46.B8]